MSSSNFISNDFLFSSRSLLKMPSNPAAWGDTCGTQLGVTVLKADGEPAIPSQI